MAKISLNFGKIIQWTIIIFVVIFTIVVFTWERDLYDDVRSWNNIDDLSPEERERMIKFYGCFSARHEITWRPIFIQTVVSTAATAYISYAYNGEFHWPSIIAIGIATFLIQYLFRSFRGFHLYQEFCDRI